MLQIKQNSENKELFANIPRADNSRKKQLTNLREVLNQATSAVTTDGKAVPASLPITITFKLNTTRNSLLKRRLHNIDKPCIVREENDAFGGTTENGNLT